MTHQSFRFRLLAIVIVGMIALAAANVLSNRWALREVQERAISDSSAALRGQALESLRRQPRRRAGSTNQVLASIKQIGLTARDIVAEELAEDGPGAPPALADGPRGWRYQHGVTTLLVPPGAGPQALDDLSASVNLDVVFPGFARAFPEISRISYLAASGALRSFPRLDQTSLPAGALPAQNPAFQASLPARNPARGAVWLPPRTAVPTGERIITAAAPVYLRDVLAGVVIVDINMEALTARAKDLGSEFGGFGFIVDNDGHLLAAPEQGQLLLLGRVPRPDEQDSVTLQAASPAFAPLIAAVRAGSEEVQTVEIGGRPYLVAHQPLSELPWSVAVIAPVDTVTAPTVKTAQDITRIADSAYLRGILIAALVALLLSALIAAVVSHQFSRPLARLLAATKALAAGQRHRINMAGYDELGQLGQAFNTMAEALEQSRAAILEANHQLEHTVQERTSALEQTVRQLGEAASSQQTLLRTLREVSTPVIPITHGVLAMPLIGLLDAERIANATQALLRRVERDGAQTVLLDITGVPLIDTAVAQALIQMVAASGLLGARVVLVGVTPEVAQTLVGQGIAMHDIRTAADIQSAITRIGARG